VISSKARWFTNWLSLASWMIPRGSNQAKSHGTGGIGTIFQNTWSQGI